MRREKHLKRACGCGSRLPRSTRIPCIILQLGATTALGLGETCKGVRFSFGQTMSAGLCASPNDVGRTRSRTESKRVDACCRGTHDRWRLEKAALRPRLLETGIEAAGVYDAVPGRPGVTRIIEDGHDRAHDEPAGERNHNANDEIEH